MIACLGETTGVDTLKNLLQLMKSTPEGLQILTDRPRINSKTVDLDALERLPPNTFGYAYKHFLRDNVSIYQTRKNGQMVIICDCLCVSMFLECDARLENAC